MVANPSGLVDKMVARLSRGRGPEDGAPLSGWVEATLRDHRGRVKLHVVTRNIITEVGDQYYGDAGAGLHASGNVADPNPVSGMRLGTGTTTPAKTGAGAAIVTYISGSAKAIDSGFPTSALNSGKRRITWETTWAAGEATNSAIAEVVITNESPLSDVAGSASDTISRALLSPTVDKQAGDTLTVTWHHDIGTP